MLLLPNAAVVVPVPSLVLTIIMAVAVEEIRATSYVGFDSITQQIEHKLLKRGFQFNVICVGILARLTAVSDTLLTD